MKLRVKPKPLERADIAQRLEDRPGQLRQKIYLALGSIAEPDPNYKFPDVFRIDQSIFHNATPAVSHCSPGVRIGSG